MPEQLPRHQQWVSKHFIRVHMHCASGPVLYAYLSDGARLENLQSQLTQRFSKQQTLLLLKNYRILRNGTCKENGVENDDIIIVFPPPLLKSVICGLRKYALGPFPMKRLPLEGRF